jgi:hypothetical protein
MLCVTTLWTVCALDIIIKIARFKLLVNLDVLGFLDAHCLFFQTMKLS